VHGVDIAVVCKRGARSRGNLCIYEANCMVLKGGERARERENKSVVRVGEEGRRCAVW
jgi:hypothetical protein